MHIRVTHALFGNTRNTATTLTLLAVALIFAPNLIRLSLRESTYFKIHSSTETVDAVVLPDRKYPLNYTVLAPHYIHPEDTAEVRIAFQRSDGSNAERNLDQRLVDDIWYDGNLDVSHVDAELEAPSFSVIRATAREAKDRPRRFVLWQFLLKPNPNVEGREKFVYRVHFRDRQGNEIATTSSVSEIEVGSSPFGLDRIAAAIGIISAAVGIFLQVTKKRDAVQTA